MQLSCQNQSPLQLLETAFQVTLVQKDVLQQSGKNIRNLSRYRAAGPFLSTFDFVIHEILQCDSLLSTSAIFERYPGPPSCLTLMSSNNIFSQLVLLHLPQQGQGMLPLQSSMAGADGCVEGELKESCTTSFFVTSHY